MITPRIFRRSLQGAFQLRLLALWWASLLVPGLLAALPISSFLGQLDHSPRAKQVVAFLDGPTLLDLVRRLGENGEAQLIASGFLGAVVVLLLLAPAMAGATVTAARSEEPLPLSRLLSGAGELYLRMLRTTLAGLIPLGLAAAFAALVLKATSTANEKAVSETQAARASSRALFAALIAVVFFHLFVDLARAHFAADPTRRSAVLALWHGVRIFFRRPLRVLTLGGGGAFVAIGLAALFMLARLQVVQAGAGAIALAWVLAQAAHLSVGWGRSTRIFAFAELVRADAADRQRTRAPFHMDPPATTPPPAPPLAVPLPGLAALQPAAEPVPALSAEPVPAHAEPSSPDPERDAAQVLSPPAGSGT